MRIGILADSHDNLPKIEKAVKIFNKKRVNFVLHAGDFIAPFVVSKLKALNCDWRGVLGNNDGEKEGLIAISEGRIQAGPLRIELDKRKIILVHDINKIKLNEYEADLIIFGHTHKPQTKRINSQLLFNPGECSGWLSNRPTIAIIDLDTLSSQIINI